MPKIPIRSARKDFMDKTIWQRSKKGNLWRHYGGMTLTIFEREGDGYYGWCLVENDDNKTFSEDACEDEAEAMDAMWDEVEMINGY